MKTLQRVLLSVVLFSGPVVPQYLYISPGDGATFVSRETNIILRAPEAIEPASLTPELFSIVGTTSGVHTGSVRVSDDGATIIFLPGAKFDANERVSVQVQGGLATVSASKLQRTSWSFQTSPLITPIRPDRLSEGDEHAGRILAPAYAQRASDTFPPDFPALQVDSINNPAPGYYMLTTSEIVPGIGFYLMMYDRMGTPYRYKPIAHHYSYDFKFQPNGTISYADIGEMWGYAGGGRTVHRVMDTNFTVIDTFACGNGYTADSHEFLLLPNGHAIVHAYDAQYVDMSALVAGGNPAALVVGSILQEIDAEKNVVFQWRSWDHLPVTDSYQNLTAASFDYVHINAYDLDTDGNLLVSCRNTSEIIKVDRATGAVMWRWGGKKNQFTFIGEHAENAPTYFSFQHCVRHTPGGTITLFDNGNLHPTPYSRAAEYRLDEVNKTATLVWEYRHSPDIVAPSRGSVQRLPNGNTLIGWGTAAVLGTGKQAVTEVTPDKQIAFEACLPAGLDSFRAWKFSWPSDVPSPSMTIPDIQPGVKYEFNKEGVATGVSIELTQAAFGYNNITVTRSPLAAVKPAFIAPAPALAPGRALIKQFGFTSFAADVYFDSTFYCGMNPATIVVYARTFEGTGVFVPLATEYDPATNLVQASTTMFGEFILGELAAMVTPQPPVPELPPDSARVNQTRPVELRWSTRGVVAVNSLQIATDTGFTSIVVDETALNSSRYIFESSAPGTRYYWRSGSANTIGSSGWSAVRSFTTSAPFMQVTAPNGGEQWTRGKKYFIRWSTNVSDLVRIELHKTTGFITVIKDSVQNIGAYAWSIPAGFVNDTIYKIVIKSVSNAGISDTTDGEFGVLIATGIDHESPGVPQAYALRQNYPNPFNPTTTITFDLPAREDVALTVHSVLGMEVARLAYGAFSAGVHSVSFDASRLPSGMYFYTLKAGKFIGTKRMILLK